jgi:MFS family permease
MISSASSIPPRRAVLLGLAAGLSVAAAIAIVAILTHSFDETDARLIATSLGFSVFSALGAAGAPARRQPKLATLGVLTTGAAGLAFALLELAIWDQTTNWAWRAFGALAVLTLAASHASLVLSARRGSDSSAITNLTVISVLTASVDAILALIAIVGLVHHISSGETRLAAVLVITMLLSTALPPILRRARPSTNSADAHAPFTTALSGSAQAELSEVAHRLEQLAPRTGDLAHEIQRETVRLRELANQPPRF